MCRNKKSTFIIQSKSSFVLLHLPCPYYHSSAAALNVKQRSSTKSKNIASAREKIYWFWPLACAIVFSRLLPFVMFFSDYIFEYTWRCSLWSLSLAASQLLLLLGFVCVDDYYYYYKMLLRFYCSHCSSPSSCCFVLLLQRVLRCRLWYNYNMLLKVFFYDK